jgi:hypothetical protein
MASSYPQPINRPAPAANDGDRLPPVVRQYMDRVLLPGELPARQIRIEQAGRMWFKPGGRSLRFSATEHFACDQVGFRWQARFPLGPLLALNVTDRYSSGDGELAVRALRLPLQRHAGRDVAIAEAYRYLAELIWVPDAILANRELEWRALDARRVEVSTEVAGERVRITFVFDLDGELERCCADARPRLVNGRSIPTPWGGAVSDYRTLAGRRMPTRAEVYWDLPEGRFSYWEATVERAEALAEPFAS